MRQVDNGKSLESEANIVERLIAFLIWPAVAHAACHRLQKVVRNRAIGFVYDAANSAHGDKTLKGMELHMFSKTMLALSRFLSLR